MIQYSHDESKKMKLAGCFPRFCYFLATGGGAPPSSKFLKKSPTSSFCWVWLPCGGAAVRADRRVVRPSATGGAAVAAAAAVAAGVAVAVAVAMCGVFLSFSTAPPAAPPDVPLPDALATAAAVAGAVDECDCCCDDDDGAAVDGPAEVTWAMKL